MYLAVLGRCVYEDELLAQRVLDVISNHDPSTPLFLFWAMHVVGHDRKVQRLVVGCVVLCNANRSTVRSRSPGRRRQVRPHQRQDTPAHTAMVNFADDKVSCLQSHSYSLSMAIG